MIFSQSSQQSTLGLGEWLSTFFESNLTGIGIPISLIAYAKLAIYLLISTLIVFVLLYLVRMIISFILKKIQSATNKSILTYTIKNKVPHYLALLVPYIFFKSFIPFIFSDFEKIMRITTKIADIYLVLMVIWIIQALIESFVNVLQERPAFAHKPMRSYLQVVQMILYSLGGIVVIAIITNQSPGVILAGLGAASAVTMLVFQDSIKGFVGSIQMTTNNMVELNDWITVDKYKADGSVEEINLTTVKIRNFDNTVTTVPTYSLISDSFQNWKPMQKSGGRRIKKSFYIKQGSIRFMKEDELTKYNKFACLKKTIEDRISRHNELDKSFIDNRVPVTNNDLFMAYAQNYLANHPEVHKGMTCMFRQGFPTGEGLPLEIYVFTNTVVWVDYERISSEIVNHLMGMIPFFDLKLYEMLSPEVMQKV